MVGDEKHKYGNFVYAIYLESHAFGYKVLRGSIVVQGGNLFGLQGEIKPFIDSAW